MKLTILGTGNAKVTKCYNTCFTLNEEDEKEYFLVDGGGGSTIPETAGGCRYQLEGHSYNFCYP